MKPRKPASNNGLKTVAGWMNGSQRKAFPFQRRVWKEILAGNSGILHSPTGTGKTLAVWLGAVADWLNDCSKWVLQAADHASRTRRINRNRAVPIQVVWVTPLRALAADTQRSLQEPIDDLKLPWTIERRTSDTSGSVKSKQKTRLPSCLITTPESLSLLLSYEQSQRQFDSLRLIVLDEWHELVGSKRGVQTELCLARLRRLSPRVKTWALSATMGNVEDAVETAVGREPGCNKEPVVIRAPSRRQTSVTSLIPAQMERFPWAGHMGLKSLQEVIQAIERSNSSLVFTNTRSQTEKWYAAILHARPDWAGQLAMHHGSLDRRKRDWVERHLAEGKLRCVVCTSSLDLGVDFFSVDQVLQVGSCKGIARLMQRAGRSGHFPGGKSKLVFVPTHALELVEIAAARQAIRNRRMEARRPMKNCLDLLAQHVITLAAGVGFNQQDLFDEVRTTHAFSDLDRRQWRWVLDFAERGGASLQAYPDFRRLVERDGKFEISDAKTARRHRLTIGTIASDPEVVVKFLNGGKLGTIEERFISKLNPGDLFHFAGRTLKLVMFRQMTAWVRRSRGQVAALPRWQGGRMPLSSELAAAVRQQLELAAGGTFAGREMRAVRPLLQLQAAWSAIPSADTLLIEQVKTRDGHHIFLYPFEGRLVHEGLAAILAWRISRLQPITFASTINDYGIELLSARQAPLQAALDAGLFRSDGLLHQIEESMNAGELDRRQFRDIARVAGLVFAGYPGESRPSRHLQASADMFFDVFREYDPENLLLKQARRQVLEQQLEYSRLASAMDRIANCELVIRQPPKTTPLAFPLLIDRLRMRLSSEKLVDRIARMTAQLEAAAEKVKHVAD